MQLDRPEEVHEALVQMAEECRQKAKHGEYWDRIADIVDNAARCADGQIAWARHNGQLGTAA